MKKFFEKTKSTTEYHVMSGGASETGTQVKLGNDIGKLEPVPFVSMTLEKYTAGDKAVGGMLNLSLNGVFHGDNFSITGKKLKDKIDELALRHECISGINIYCGDTKIIDSGIGYIKSYSFPEGPQKNWMNIIPYTMEIAISHNGRKPVVQADPHLKTKYNIDDTVAIRSISENVSWSLNENTLQMYNPDPSKYNEYSGEYSNEHIVVRYSLDVEGFGVCCGSGVTLAHEPRSALDSAKHVIDYRLNNLQNLNKNSFSCTSGILPEKYNTEARFNHTRDVSVNELNGRLSVNGEYIIRPSGAGEAQNTLMTMESSTDSSLDSGEKTVTLNGNIKGLVQNEYDDSKEYGPKDSKADTMTKVATAMDAAESALQRIVVNGSGIVKELAAKNQLIKFEAAIGDVAGSDEGKELYDIDGSQASNQWTAGDTGYNEFRLLTKSFKRNYADKSIDFTLTYSNKSRHKIPFALWAEVSVDHEMPSRRLVEHVIPGRGYPLMQDIMCDTQDVFTINVTAQFEPNKNIETIINAAREQILILIYNTAVNLGIGGYIRTGDSENIANNGSYKRSIKLTSPTCNNITTSNTTLHYLDAPGDTYTNAAGFSPTAQEAMVVDHPEPVPDASTPEYDKTRDEKYEES
tara:strand:- start:1651 stop:3549 length:1899 start_codon:yes stop_codon:yes gene_type:complete